MSTTENNVLYGYFRSTAAYRVRIALAFKGLSVDNRLIRLKKGEQTQAAYRKINPAGLVPYWIDGDIHLAQSLAIIEYLNDLYPEPLCFRRTPKLARSFANWRWWSVATSIRWAICAY